MFLLSSGFFLGLKISDSNFLSLLLPRGFPSNPSSYPLLLTCCCPTLLAGSRREEGGAFGPHKAVTFSPPGSFFLRCNHFLFFTKMGDHFVLLVDRLLTESTLEATIESRSQSLPGQTAVATVQYEPDCSPQKINLEDQSLKLVECRICQDDDLESNMETPCSCCGSLKYAHRKCVQRWCNEKGDIVCEICLQQFKPGYTAPPLFHYGGIPMNFRGNWEVSRRDLHNPRFIAMVAADRSFVDADYDDYSTSSTRSMLYCRSVAAIFMILLVLRHTLPIMISGGDEQYSLTELLLLVLRIGGILLPVYIMARVLALFHRRRRQQELSMNSSEGGSEQQRSLPWVHSEPHLIRVH